MSLEPNQLVSNCIWKDGLLTVQFKQPFDTPCSLLIQTLKKLDMSTRLDLSESIFRNDGQMVKYHASTYEIALYDKVKDLEQASKYGAGRGAENDYDCQLDFLSGLKRPEVLRLEIRLKSKKLKTLLATLGFKSRTTFKELFCADLSRAVLLHYWDEITKGLYILNIDVTDTEKLVDNIRTHFPGKRPTSVLALMGFIRACHDVGVRGTKILLRLNDAQFYRLKADAKKLEQDGRSAQFRILAAIRAQLREFIPIIRDDIVVLDLLKSR